MNMGEASRLYQDQIEARRAARHLLFDDAELEEIDRLVDQSTRNLFATWMTNERLTHDPAHR